MFSFIQVPLCFRGQRLSEADTCQDPTGPSAGSPAPWVLPLRDSHLGKDASVSLPDSLHFSYQSVSLWAPAPLSSRL